MSSALVRAVAPLKPELRLAEAVSLFEADLSPEQKGTFRIWRDNSRRSPPDIQDVMHLTAEIDRRKLGFGRCFGPRLTNVLQAIQQFAALGDIVVGGAQNIVASGVWTLVRMTLLSLVNFSSCLEKMSTLFMIVGRSAPRYERMALLYPRSRNLRSHLSEYFIVVVRLCHQMLKFTKKSVLGQLVSFLSDSDMNSYQSELDRWANMIKEEVSLLMAQNIEEQGTHLKVLSKFSTAESHRQKLKAHVRVLNYCSTYNYQTTWKEIRKIGKSTLLERAAPEYHQWKAQTSSQTLVCTGKLGSGKSVLLANIVDDLILHAQSQSTKCPVAYFFCRHDISDSLKAHTVVCSLARQLLRPIPDLTMVETFLNETDSILDFRGVLDVLLRALPPDFKAYFVLDGLDECDDVEKETLLRQLRELQATFTLLICTSFRLEAGTVSNLDSQRLTSKHSTITIPEDNADIDAFITTELERRMECTGSTKLNIGDPMLIIEIRDALLRGAQGMFLWVALQIESLCAEKTDDAIRQALSDLPKDLPTTFYRILQRWGEGQRGQYQIRIFELMIAAHRPLTTEDLREALSVVPGDAVWNPARLLNDVYSVLSCCGCLIIVDEEELTVRLVHHSVKQFLLGGFKDASGAKFTMERANRTMASVIVTYLSYGVFDTQLSTMVVPQVMMGHAPSRIIRSTTEASTMVRNLALKLLKSRGQVDYDLGKMVAETNQRFMSLPREQFQFYAYANSHFMYHSPYILSDQPPDMCSMLLDLLEQNAHRIDTTADGCSMLLNRAVEKGHEEITRLLVEMGAEVETTGSSGQTLLASAVAGGHEAIVELLLATGQADVNSRNYSGQTPLWIAADRGYTAITELLLNTDNIDVDSADTYYRMTPLASAALNGHKAIVKRLLGTFKVNVNSRNYFHQTPLSVAAEMGHTDIVELLLQMLYVDFSSSGGSRMTPLSHAAKNGHEAIVKLLLDTGRTNINWRDSSTWIPLFWAAKKGHKSIFKLLLASGQVQFDLNPENDIYGQTILVWAVRAGYWDTVKELIATGTLDLAWEGSGNRQTLLLWGAENGDEHIVKVVLGTGRADVNARTFLGWTPLSCAVVKGHEAIVRLLLGKKKVNVNSKDYSGRTPLWWAASEGREDIVELFLSSGRDVDVNCLNIDHQSPLWCAAAKGYDGIVKLLLGTGRVDVDVKDIFLQRTPLLCATAKGYESIVELLLDTNKVDVNAKDAENQTPLLWAVENRHTGIIKLLLSIPEINIDIADTYNRTPLWWAAENGYEDAVKLLMAMGRDRQVDVRAMDSIFRQPPASRAAEKGYWTIVDLLVRRNY